MKISVAICTWNRSRLLRQTLQSLCDMTIPAEVDWELILIDNCSTDDTKLVAHSFGDQLPLNYFHESTPGHAVSRNRAIHEASGRYILWTDNDVIVSKNWIGSYIDGFDQHEDAAFFGGKIEPVFEAGKPDWIDATWEKCKGVFATRDLGQHQVELGNGTFPYGANFAVKTSVQKQFLFDTTHGRKGAGMVGDEEIAVLDKISKVGHRGVWLPKASLKHLIPADRATTAYVGRYFVGQGQTNIIRNKVNKSPTTAFGEWIRFQMLWRLKRFWSQPDEWVSHLIRANLSRGEFLALRQNARSSQ